MDEFIVQLLAQLDTSKVIKDYNTLKQQLEKQINIKVNLDTSGQKDISKLVEQIQTALSKASNGKLNIDTSQIISALNQVSKNAQATGQQIGDAINKGVENSVKKATNALKSFSELKIGTGNISAIFDKNGLLDVEKSLDKIKKKYSEFGQVKITDKLFDSDGNLHQFRVNIQQINGDLKESRSFMMALANSGKSFVFPNDVIKGSESFVHHLNDAKKTTNEVLTEEEKLANIMADVREKTEQTRQVEEKRQQLAQSNAINKSLEQEYNQRQKISEQLSSKVNKIQLSIDTGGYESKVNAIIAKTQQWTDKNGEARISTTNLSNTLHELTEASNAYANNPTEATQKRLIESSGKLDSEYKKITSSVRTMNAEMAKDSSVASLHNQVSEFMSKNGKTVKHFGTDLKNIFNQTVQGAELSNQELTKLKQKFIEVQNAARNAGKLGKTWFQTLREGMSSFSYWTSSTFLVMKAIQSIKGGLGTVKALDTALVDLKKTTTMTASELEDFYYSSNKVAKQMGVTTEEIINQASAFSRLGWSSTDAATKMAKFSSQFASISPGMNVDEATTNLTSIIKAYDIKVDDILDGVLSKINQIGNTFGTSNAEIAEGLRLSSAAMASLGGTFEENIALFTAGQEILQDASQMGNAIRSITMRIKGYDEETQEFSKDVVEATGKVADLTKVASNNNMGISMFTDASQTHYKSLVDYLGQISDIWDEIDEKSQVALLQNLFGKNRAQAGAAIINNFDTVRKSLEAMENSAGSADREMSVIMDKQNCPYVQKCA